jgi:hypothetical protein
MLFGTQKKKKKKTFLPDVGLHSCHAVPTIPAPPGQPFPPGCANLSCQIWTNHFYQI